MSKTNLFFDISGGAVNAVPSKSSAHRIIICSALSDSQTEVEISGLSDDVRATVSAAEALGSRVEIVEDRLIVYPHSKACTGGNVLCGESASTLRLCLPVFAALGIPVTFLTAGSLKRRKLFIPRDEYLNHGVTVMNTEEGISVSGKLTGGEFSVDGAVTSQNLSGLALSLPLVNGLRLSAQHRSVSMPYFDMTARVMKDFGVELSDENGIVTANGCYSSPSHIKAEGDWSSAAYWFVLGAIGDLPVTVHGLNYRTAQGDKRILDILFRCGVRIEHDVRGGAYTVYPSVIKPFSFDVSATPDLFPLLGILGSAAAGRCVLSGAAALRYKESDRLFATADMINSIGGNAVIGNDSLVVRGFGRGRSALSGGACGTHGDHRMVMAAAIASAICRDGVEINETAAVSKSYPRFFDDYISLGGRIR